MSLKAILEEEMAKLEDAYRVCGIIDKNGCVYPLGADTKVLSTIFELVSRPAVYNTAKRLGMEVVEPFSQNSYPDFTLVKIDEEKKKKVEQAKLKAKGKVIKKSKQKIEDIYVEKGKIAIDVKTTYREDEVGKFSYTLGGYTSFIRPGNHTKNIVFPFHDYTEHWVLGFVYEREGTKKSQAMHAYTADQLDEIELPFKNVETFVQEKWRIASGSAGSGNTTNIGSINATLPDFEAGNGPFESEEEFLEYWCAYGRTKADRGDFSTVEGFRQFKQR